MLAPQKESFFGCSCRLWLLSLRRARVFARSCSLLSKYLPISWKQRKEQSHAQCHVTHPIKIFDKISEHVKVAKSVDIAVPELAVTAPGDMPGFKKYDPLMDNIRSDLALDGIDCTEFPHFSKKLFMCLKLFCLDSQVFDLQRMGFSAAFTFSFWIHCDSLYLSTSQLK